MSRQQNITRAQRIIEKFASSEHTRLQTQLEGIALEVFSIYQDHPSVEGIKPDVFKISSDRKNLFIGDAKNAENERATRQESLKRIEGYYEFFQKKLKSGTIKSGVFAIATNCSDSVDGWIDALNDLAGSELNSIFRPFKKAKTDEKTFLAIQIIGDNVYSNH